MKSKISSIIGILLLLVGIGCAGYKVHYKYQGSVYAKAVMEIAEEFHENGAPSDKEVNYENSILKLKEINEDIVGWLQVPGTNIDYPVVQTDNNEYYLDHSINKESDKHGSIYMDYNVDTKNPNSNQVFYGHHMKDGTMFKDLVKYKKKTFFEKNSTINYINEDGEEEIYRIIGVFYWDNGKTNFPYNTYIDLENEQVFQSYIEWVKKLSIYDTSEVHNQNHKLITLSTCDYRTNDSRFVVVGQLE